MGLAFWLEPERVDSIFMAGSTALAGALTAWWLWSWLMWKDPLNRRRAMLVGALGGVVCHWVFWVVALLSLNSCFAVITGCAATLGTAPVHPFFTPIVALMYMPFGLMTMGWMTVPAGTLLAILFVKYHGKKFA